MTSCSTWRCSASQMTWWRQQGTMSSNLVTRTRPSCSTIRSVTVTVTELRSSTMFSEESCSVGLSEKMGFQLRSELFATLLCGEWRSGESAFQTTGATMEKLRWPMDVFARETNKLPRSAKRSDRRDKSETGQMTCLR